MSDVTKRTCRDCGAEVYHVFLVHHHPIEETDFNDLSQWYWMGVCTNRHYTKQTDKVSLEQIKEHYPAFQEETEQAASC